MFLFLEKLGAGKSSVINLLAGRQVAETSSGHESLTLHYDAYGVAIDDVPYRIYDTTGFDDYRTHPGGFLYAITDAHKLAKELHEKGGVSLLLYCVKGDRIPSTFITDYRLLYEFLFEEKVPVALVATHLEGEDHMDDWYTRNKEWFERQEVKYVDHACITAADNLDPKYRKKYDMSRIEVGKLIRRQARRVEHWNQGNLSHGIEETDDSSTGHVSRADVLGVLTKRCGLGESLAKAVIRNINIVLFGQAGAGKDSLINLMAGKDIVGTSMDLKSPKLHWQKYTIAFDGESYDVFDTVGLEEPQLGMPQFLDAIENAYSLIHELERQDGIDLLLFCMRACSVTITLQTNYLLFNEFLCDKKVPIILVITHLENEPRDMDDWWKRNRENFYDREIFVASHACITTIRGNFPRRYEESRIAIPNVVKEFTADGQKHAWKGGDDLFVSFMRKLRELLVGNRKPARKSMTSRLTKRCGMSLDVAKLLADRIKNDEAELL
ncbi:hypothetical protein EDB19DRAFT_1858673 [Suillus lakei]|nr:hypothetical protein EDB19DRAFT_1858673 [Suillus lakei]